MNIQSKHTKKINNQAYLYTYVNNGYRMSNLHVYDPQTTCFYFKNYVFLTPTQSYYEYYLLPTDGVDFSLISFLSVKKKITSLKASVCKEKAMRKLDKLDSWTSWTGTYYK